MSDDLLVRLSAPPRWFEAHEQFFGPFYFRGDHSYEGFFSGRPMTNDERTAREVEGIWRLLGLSGAVPLQILDAPCGYGRHLVELARRGMRMSGVDLSHCFVRTLQRRLERDGLQAEVRHGELIELPFADGAFDVVLNLFFSFGFYLDDDDNLTCAKEFFRVLRPGGRLLFHTEVNVPQLESGKYNQPKRRLLEDGSTLDIDERMDWVAGRLVGSWTINGGRSGGVVRRSYSMRVYRPEEFEALCRRAGFARVRVLGGLDPATERYGRESDEMVVIAEKE